ncbi:hypothetical protein FHS01_001553 [Longimicrobium terrae]|nr:hypothetical protein [Longimicrobium terrae]MBB4635541.1 hypothetical protein [Longimicrobium terrae]
MTSVQMTAVTSADEFGAALLSDAEHFLNHAVEQQASVWRVLHSGHWFSPAWLTVSFYYWAYFLALTVTRLVGRSVAWVDGESLKALKKLAPPVKSPPGPGTYRTAAGPMLSATMREVEIRKDNKKAHAAVWALLFDRFQSLAVTHNCDRGTTLEDRVFYALSSSGKRLGQDWPSALRNLVNYRAGFAYDTVIHVGSLGSFAFVKVSESNSIHDVVERFETAMEQAVINPSIANNVRPYLNLLVELTFLLNSAVFDLYGELGARYSLDGRWNDQRRRFLRERGLDLSNGLWPS